MTFEQNYDKYQISTDSPGVQVLNTLAVELAQKVSKQFSLNLAGKKMSKFIRPPDWGWTVCWLLAVSCHTKSKWRGQAKLNQAEAKAKGCDTAPVTSRWLSSA